MNEDEFDLVMEDIRSLEINELIDLSHGTAKEKGWWPEDKERSFMECLMLIVSEIAEAGEEYRKFGTAPEMMIYNDSANKTFDRCLQDLGYKPEGIAIELADALIRMADLCGRHSIPLNRALKMKLEYNKGRPFRHGGKLA